MSLHTLILAAGEGRRFGNALKQLASIDEQTFLERSIRTANALTPGQVHIVLGYDHPQLSPLAANAEIVINERWHTGMGSSIACGISALPASASAVLILLCDQINVNARTIETLYLQYSLANSRDNKDAATTIACATYDQQLGVPAIFPRCFFPQLEALTGDVGAKKLLYENTTTEVALQEAAIDIDTQEELAQFIAAENYSKPAIGENL